MVICRTCVLVLASAEVIDGRPNVGTLSQIIPADSGERSSASLSTLALDVSQQVGTLRFIFAGTCRSRRPAFHLVWSEHLAVLGPCALA